MAKRHFSVFDAGSPRCWGAAKTTFDTWGRAGINRAVNHKSIFPGRNILSRNDVVDGSLPSRRLTAFDTREGNFRPRFWLLIQCLIFNCGENARPSRVDGVSRRDGGGPIASFRPSVFAGLLLCAAVGVSAGNAAEAAAGGVAQPKWGRITAATNGTGVVTLDVREWPADGRLNLPTPFAHITRADLVEGRQRRALRWLFNADATQLLLELPPTAPANLPAVIELETAEKSAQFAGGRITFSALDAKVAGSKAKLESHPGNHRVGFWTDAADAVTWEHKATRWGRYDVEVTYSAAGGEGTELLVEVAGKTFTVARPSTGSWYRYATLPVGRFYLEKQQPFSVKVGCATLKGAAVANLKAVTLRPAPEGEAITQDAVGVVTLAASNAITYSVTMRYEPAEKKNCMGYWVNPADWAEWEFAVTKPGVFTVEVSQGCVGGGSKVFVEAGGAQLEFEVENTGHFQNFKPRVIGEVTLKAAGTHVLAIKPQTKKGGAVMDIRQVRLVPVGR